MIIAFMGNDGSGKTTISKEITKIFRGLGLRVFYKHEYEYFILKFLFKIVGMEKIGQERKKMIVKRERSWKYYIWPFMVWFDGFFQYLCFKLFIGRKAIVVLDRYLYDHYMSFDYLGYLTPLSRWMYLHFPKPDVGIILWVDPYVAYERKKDTHDYPVEYYERQTESYLKLARQLDIPTINTDKEIGQTLGEIIRYIIYFLYEKGELAQLSKLSTLQLNPSSKIKKISVIIPTYKRNDKLLELLRSLKKEVENLESSIEVEIIAVDDSETKDAENLLKRFVLEFRKGVSVFVQWSGGNRYPSFCRNLGAKYARGDVLVFVDDDNKLSGRVLQTIVSYFSSFTFLGMLGVINYDEKGIVWSIGGKLIKTPFSVITKNLRKIPKNSGKLVLADYVPNLYAIPRKLFMSLGGFDAHFFPQGLEEVDLSLRIWKNGRLVGVAVDKGSYTIHLFGDVTKIPDRPSRYFLRGRSRVLLYYKHFRKLILWMGLPDIILRSVKTFTYKISLRNRISLIQEYIRGVREGLMIIKEGRKYEFM
jgi:GT2 family glycosyltransferase/thymidylate kinase